MYKLHTPELERTIRWRGQICPTNVINSLTPKFYRCFLILVTYVTAEMGFLRLHWVKEQYFLNRKPRKKEKTYRNKMSNKNEYEREKLLFSNFLQFLSLLYWLFTRYRVKFDFFFYFLCERGDFNRQKKKKKDFCEINRFSYGRSTVCQGDRSVLRLRPRADGCMLV